MKLPKDFPIKLMYVLLIIFIWDYMVFPSEKEQFNMKTLNDIKMMLFNKNKNKEEFDMKMLTDIKKLLSEKIYKYNSKNTNDNTETYESFDKEEEKKSVMPWSTMRGSPIN
tara:strand:- start:18 stop:350 length:333 start_codon:yes stop_codon:yes gene_type:complete